MFHPNRFLLLNCNGVMSLLLQPSVDNERRLKNKVAMELLAGHTNLSSVFTGSILEAD